MSIARATGDETGPDGRVRRPSLVSVVMPARNARPTLEAQLEALRAQDYAGPWELVVADNGSTDGTAGLTRRWAGTLPVRVVDAASSRGASFARNRGWRSARGDLIAFCDADDVVDSRWLSRLAKAAEEADLVGGPYEFGRLNDNRSHLVGWRKPSRGAEFPSLYGRRKPGRMDGRSDRAGWLQRDLSRRGGCRALLACAALIAAPRLRARCGGPLPLSDPPGQH